jgi:hypothetical protein
VETEHWIAAVSALFSLCAVIIAGRALRQSASGEISVEWVRRSPGGDRYRVGVTNVGGAAARHAVVTLFDDEGRRLCGPSPEHSLLGGESHVFELVEPALEPAYPLTVRFEWRRWKRRKSENYRHLGLLWRLRGKSTRVFARPDVEALDVPTGAVAGHASGWASPGPVYLRRSRAKPAAVAQHLKLLDEKCRQPQPPWAELLQVAGPTGRLGEIKDPEDWADFPQNQSIRVAAITSGGELVIRWVADQQWVKDHDSFYRVDDAERPRTGSVRLFSEDEPLLVES